MAPSRTPLPVNPVPTHSSMASATNQSYGCEGSSQIARSADNIFSEMLVEYFSQQVLTNLKLNPEYKSRKSLAYNANLQSIMYIL